MSNLKKFSNIISIIINNFSGRRIICGLRIKILGEVGMILGVAQNLKMEITLTRIKILKISYNLLVKFKIRILRVKNNFNSCRINRNPQCKFRKEFLKTTTTKVWKSEKNTRAKNLR